MHTTPTIERQALTLIAPYTNSAAPGHDRYPGRHRLWHQALGGRVKPNTIRIWQLGRQSAPQWARDMLANHLERNAYAALECARALRAKEKGAP